MDKIWFETRETKLQIDKNGIFEMMQGSSYIRIKLSVDQIEKLSEFLELPKKGQK